MIQAQYFDTMYRSDPDPWQVASTWYERRKRALLLASLPSERYRHGFEAGCGNGETTVRLLERCAHVSAADFSEKAVQLCSTRIAEADRARLDLQALALPQEWPALPMGGFDLIVVSELAYYLDDVALAEFTRQCLDSLSPGGHWVMCHWRHDAPDRQQCTEALHRNTGKHPQLLALLGHTEADFQLDIWEKTPLQGNI